MTTDIRDLVHSLVSCAERVLFADLEADTDGRRERTAGLRASVIAPCGTGPAIGEQNLDSGGANSPAQRSAARLTGSSASGGYGSQIGRISIVSPLAGQVVATATAASMSGASTST